MAGSRLALVGLTALALLAVPATVSAAHGKAPAGPTRLGFCEGDDWEPELAHSGSTVYVVTTHYPQPSSCGTGSTAGNTIDIQQSTDGGTTWTPPKPVFTGSINGVSYSANADPVVAIDSAGYVHVSFLGYGNSGGHTDIVAAKSTTPFGTTFTAVKVNSKDCKNCDHEKIAISGPYIYLAYSQATSHFMAMSSDGGTTWTQSTVRNYGVVAFAEGMVVDSSGNVYTAWGDCLSSSCGGTPAATYSVSKTLAGSLTTTFVNVASGDQGPACPFTKCGFSYFGPQSDIAIDAANNLYMVWQDGQVPTTRSSPPVMYIAKSADGGSTWSAAVRADDKGNASAYALFPTVTAGAANHVWVAWMDDRQGNPINHMNGWNVWMRASTDGGATFPTGGTKVSAYDPSRAESQMNGYMFPYGDYFGFDVNTCGQPELVWGEGPSYAGPGHTIYRTFC
jgi:hypothetical protein